MANRRISHARGRGSITHNNRNHIYGNVDQTKTEDNIYYAKENMDAAYQKCFGQALENYNAKQKRADRKIDDYYTHLFSNGLFDFRLIGIRFPARPLCLNARKGLSIYPLQIYSYLPLSDMERHLQGCY